MILNIKNIGLVRDAEIILDGITVIAGENNTGKSTSHTRLRNTLSDSPYSGLRDSILKMCSRLQRNILTMIS